jgi:uncharacterized membrane protein (UPF0127 family)
MSTDGRLRGYALVLVALVVLLSTTGYFLAGLTLNPRVPREPPLLAANATVVIETSRGVLELPVYQTTNPGQRIAAGRNYIKPGTSVLFRFPSARDDSWSSQGLREAVSVAFMDSRGRVLTILDIEPCHAVSPPGEPLPNGLRAAPRSRACRSYPPRVVYRQVLEVSRGWFAQNQVGPGAVVSIERPEASR